MTFEVALTDLINDNKIAAYGISFFHEGGFLFPWVRYDHKESGPVWQSQVLVGYGATGTLVVELQSDSHFGKSFGKIHKIKCSIYSIVKQFYSRKALACVPGDVYENVHCSVVYGSWKQPSVHGK